MIIIPFGKWKDFKDCVKDIMKSKGFDEKRAAAYCATIERTIEERRKAKNFDEWEYL